MYALNNHIIRTELQVWIGIPLFEKGEIGLFRVAPCFDGSGRPTRLRPLSTGRNTVGLGWAKHKSLARPLEKEPHLLAVDEVGLVSGRGLCTPSSCA